MSRKEEVKGDTIVDGLNPEDAVRWLKHEIGTGRFTRDELARLMGFLAKAVGMKSLTLNLTLSVNGGTPQHVDTIHAGGE